MTEIDQEKEEEMEEEITPMEVTTTTTTTTSSSSSSSATTNNNDGVIDAIDVVSTKKKKKKKKRKQPIGRNLIDKNVRTPYGFGIVLEFRERDDMYKIKLSPDQSSGAMATTLYTQDTPEYIKTIQDEINELNVAYEALEKMRRMNLEMECFEKAGITDVNYSYCTQCLLDEHGHRHDHHHENDIDSNVEGDTTQGPGTVGTSARRPIGEEHNQHQKRSRFPRLQNFVDHSQKFVEDTSKFVEDTSNDPDMHKRFPRLSKLWGGPAPAPAPSSSRNTATTATSSTSSKSKQITVLPRIQKYLDERQKASASPCLICASMSCSEHSSAGFRKEGITLCLSCERLFELNFIVDCVSTPDEVQRSKHIDHMVDCYDRCLLLLEYSTQYVDQIAAALEQQKEQVNKVGLGSSGVGALSGVLGIAAAATILTPAGPPLLIASLFFGGGATAVQTGAEAMNYFSEPNKLADRIIALHGVLLSILRVTSTLRDAMLRDHIRTDVFEAESKPLSAQVQSQIEKNRLGIAAGANVGRSITLGGAATMEVAGAGAVTAGVAGAEAAAGGAAASASASAAAVSARGAAAGARGVSNTMRVSTAAARTLRFARFAGGALSAAVLVLEANSIQSTLKDIQNGNPCQKAEQIRKIGKEISERQLPSTSALDEECQAYLQALANRPVPPPEVAAVPGDDGSVDQFPQAECQAAPSSSTTIDNLSMSAMAMATGPTSGAGVVIIEGDEPEAEAVDSATLLSSSSQHQDHQNRSFMSAASTSLLQRIQGRQERRREAASARSEEVIAAVADYEGPRASEVNLVL